MSVSILPSRPSTLSADQRNPRLGLDTQKNLYDCLYLALVEAVDGIMVTADRKLVAAVSGGPYGRRVMWVEDLPSVP